MWYNISMNIFHKLFQPFRKAYLLIGKVLGAETPPPLHADYLDAFETCDIAYRCIHLICSKIANINLHLYRMNKKEEIEEIYDHEILDLIARPNPQTTKWELLYLIEMSKILSGNAYVLKLRKGKNVKGGIQELWLLRPDWVKVKVANDGSLVYHYQTPKGMKDYPEEDIVHIKAPSLKSPVFGSPVVKPIINIIRNYVYSVRWNTKFFYNEARPDALIISKTKISDDEKEEFRRKWQERFSFMEGNVHRPAFISGEGIDYKIIAQTAKDMDFSNLLRISRESIMISFGVPKPILMPEAGNKSTVEGAIYIFYNDTIKPEMQMIVEKFNEFLVAKDFDEYLFLDFDNPVPEDVDLKIRVYESALRNNWMVINEVRDKEGLPPLEGGWNWYLPMMMTTQGTYEKEKIIGGGITQKEYEKAKKEKWQKEMRAKYFNGKRSFKASQKDRKEIVDKIKEILQNQTQEEERILKYWQDCELQVKVKSDNFKKLLLNETNKQKERVIEKLKKVVKKGGKKKEMKDLIDDIFNLDEEIDVFDKLARPTLTIIVGQAGEEMMRRIGAEMRFNLTQEMQRWIESRSELFAKSINETTFDKLKSTLTEGYGAGEGIGDLINRVEDVYKEFPQWRAEMVTRTEVHGASINANMDAFEQAGFEKHKWINPGIAKEPRETHMAANGQVVRVKDYFIVGGKKTLGPGLFNDPAEDINCHCQILPVK